jgi:hypothetical protein
MGPVEQAVIVTAIPLLGYRIREAAVRIPGLVVVGPVRTAEEALEQSRHDGATLYLCDEPSTHHLVKHWPTWMGWIIRITENYEPAEPAREPVLVTLSLHDPLWQTLLQRLLAAASMTTAGEDAVPDQPNALVAAQPHVRLERRVAPDKRLAAILPVRQRDMRMRLNDPDAALLDAHTFDAVVHLLPSLGIPAYMLFVDITGAPPPLRPVQRWYDQAGLKLRGSLRADDLVFRLDTSLFAALAACSTEDNGVTIATRLRWIISQPEGVRVDRIVHSGALWRPGDPVNELVPRAWEQALLLP